jgi:hypothetical protein
MAEVWDYTNLTRLPTAPQATLELPDYDNLSYTAWGVPAAERRCSLPGVLNLVCSTSLLQWIRSHETRRLVNSCRLLRFLLLGVLPLGVLLLAGLPTVSAADDWSQFRGPRGDGVMPDARLPQQWSEQSHVAWKVPIPGRGWSQPIVAGNRIFVTTAISDKLDEDMFWASAAVAGNRLILRSLENLYCICDPATAGGE